MLHPQRESHFLHLHSPPRHQVTRCTHQCSADVFESINLAKVVAWLCGSLSTLCASSLRVKNNNNDNRSSLWQPWKATSREPMTVNRKGKGSRWDHCQADPGSTRLGTAPEQSRWRTPIFDYGTPDSSTQQTALSGLARAPTGDAPTQACKPERFPDMGIAERLSRWNGSAWAQPWLPVLAIFLLIDSAAEGVQGLSQAKDTGERSGIYLNG